MGFPSSSDHQNMTNYYVIYNLTMHDASVLYACDMRPLNESQCEHSGHVVEVLRCSEVEATVRLSNYVIKCDKDKNYYISNIKTIQHDVQTDSHTPEIVRIINIAAEALMFAFRPTERTHERIQNLLNMLYRSDNDVVRSSEFLSLLDTQENSVNTIYRDDAHILLHAVNVTDVFDLNMYVNNTYVNVIHDCESVCVQSLLSDHRSFETHSAIERDGHGCAMRLLTTHMPWHYYNTTHGTLNAAQIQQNTISIALSGISAVCGMSIATCVYVYYSSSNFARNIRKRLSNFVHRAHNTKEVKKRSNIYLLHPWDEAQQDEAETAFITS